MKTQKNFPWYFWIQIIPLFLLFFWVWYINTPTNVLNANAMWGLLESVGRYSGVVAFLIALPVGITGLQWWDEECGMHKATKVLAVVNLCIAGLVAVSFLLFIILLFSGAFSV